MNARVLNVLIVDDEPLARRKLRRFLEGEPDAHCAGECGDGLAAIAQLQKGGLDLVFLDVQMPDLSGIEVIEKLGAERMPAVVFVTAFDQYAVRAFELHAVDYLLKPFDRERFRVALERARARASVGRESLVAELRGLIAELSERSRFLDRFLVRKSEGILVVPALEVDWIESQGNYVALHTNGGAHMLRETLSGLEGRLDPACFVRVRRTAIVNAGRIAALRPWSKDEHVVVLESGARIAVSRGYRERVERQVAGV